MGQLAAGDPCIVFKVLAVTPVTKQKKQAYVKHVRINADVDLTGSEEEQEEEESKRTGEEGEEEEEGRRGQQHDDDSNHVRHSIGADERYGNEMLMGESSETSNTNSPTTKSPC